MKAEVQIALGSFANLSVNISAESFPAVHLQMDKDHKMHSETLQHDILYNISGTRGLDVAWTLTFICSITSLRTFHFTK